MVHMSSMDRWRSNLKTLRSWTDEIRIEWFVKDTAKAMKLDAEGIKKYLGEEFVKYVQ